MRTRLAVVLASTLGVGLVAPGASAKVYFPMRDHVFAVGKHVRIAVPGCDSGPGCISGYPGPVRIYLIRAKDVPVPFSCAPACGEPPRRARDLGRLGDRGRLRFAPHAAGKFRLVALATVGTEGDLRTMQMPVSPVFRVHPRGWEPSG